MEGKLISMADAAELLGLKASTLHKWTMQQKIDHVRIGGLIKFEQDAVEKFIIDNRIPAKSLHGKGE